MFKLDEQSVKKLEMLLNRPISDEEGSREHFDQFTDNDLSDIRLLTKGGIGVDATKYVMFLLNGRGGIRNAASFVESVIKGDLPLSEWLEHYYKPESHV